ncbi:hypothetical protein [Actinomadura nitritigenes]|uniref:hypothetical protein n=1 Tax=Actinomadura nitritigenes TaxID=134602 RepID=UPI003D8A6AA1
MQKAGGPARFFAGMVAAPVRRSRPPKEATAATKRSLRARLLTGGPMGAPNRLLSAAADPFPGFTGPAVVTSITGGRDPGATTVVTAARPCGEGRIADRRGRARHPETRWS